MPVAKGGGLVEEVLRESLGSVRRRYMSAGVKRASGREVI